MNSLIVNYTQHAELPVAVVTGGTSGIGLAIVHELAADHLVYAIGRDDKKIKDLENKTNIIPIKLDLIDKKEREKFFKNINKINVLVHSAANLEQISIENSDYDLWQKVFNINVFVPAEVTRLSLHKLREHLGRVIFINSGAGQRGIAGHTVYVASKFALRGIADSLRLEEAAAGIRVATIYPGPTKNINKKEYKDKKLKWRESEARDHAKAVRIIVDIGNNTQISEISVRPRIDYDVE